MAEAHRNEAVRKRSIEEIFNDHELVTDALCRAVQRALLRHKKLGQSIVIWKDGRVVVVPPEEIEVDDGE